MKTPEEKYNNDPEYCRMVDSLVSYIEGHKFAPSEMREMVMFACIRYEQMQVRSGYLPFAFGGPISKSSFEQMSIQYLRETRAVIDKPPYHERNYVPTKPYKPLYIHDIFNAEEPTSDEKVNFLRNWDSYENEALPIYNIIAYAKNRRLNCLLAWLVKNGYIREVEG